MQQQQLRTSGSSSSSSSSKRRRGENQSASKKGSGSSKRRRGENRSASKKGSGSSKRRQGENQSASKKKGSSLDPHAPKRPMGAYFLFQGTQLVEMKQARPSETTKVLMREVSERWTAMDAAARAPFEEAFQASVVLHQRQLQAYEAAGGGEAGKAAAAEVDGALVTPQKQAAAPKAAAAAAAKAPSSSSESSERQGDKLVQSASKKGAAQAKEKQPSPRSQPTIEDIMVYYRFPNGEIKKKKYLTHVGVMREHNRVKGLEESDKRWLPKCYRQKIRWHDGEETNNYYYSTDKRKREIQSEDEDADEIPDEEHPSKKTRT